MKRYFTLWLVQLRASLQTSLQYRVDFVVSGAMSLFWLVWQIMPAWMVWRLRPTVAGWTMPEAALVLAWFIFLRGILEGAVQPSILATVEHIRKGTLDFVLIKPADAQFLVSTTKLEPWHVLDLFSGVAVAIFALSRLHHTPHASEIAVAFVLTLASAAMLYAFSILVVSAAFWVVRLDNLIYLFNSVFDAARWPMAVFTGFWRILFTFIIPIIVMTSYPAMALTGALRLRTAAFAVLGAITFVAISRMLWKRAIGHYTSASS